MYKNRGKGTTANLYSLSENHKTRVLAGCQADRREEEEGANSWDKKLSNMKTP